MGWIDGSSISSILRELFEGVEAVQGFVVATATYRTTSVPRRVPSWYAIATPVSCLGSTPCTAAADVRSRFAAPLTRERKKVDNFETIKYRRTKLTQPTEPLTCPPPLSLPTLYLSFAHANTKHNGKCHVSRQKQTIPGVRRVHPRVLEERSV